MRLQSPFEICNRLWVNADVGTKKRQRVRSRHEPRRETRKLSNECLVEDLISFCQVASRVKFGIRHRRKTHGRLRASFSSTGSHWSDLEAVGTIGAYATCAREPYLLNKRPRL